MNHIPKLEYEETLEYARDLAKKTLAFHLADNEQRNRLLYLFESIAKNIEPKIQEPEKRIIYGRTLLSLDNLKKIDRWIDKNIDVLFENCDSQNNLITVLWNLIYSLLPNGNILKLSKDEAPEQIANLWINGRSFDDIYKSLKQIDCKIKAGKKIENLTVQHIVNICEKNLAFDGMLILGAVIELVPTRATRERLEKIMSKNYLFDFNVVDVIDILLDSLRQLQKAIKYGLPNEKSIKIYEKGYCDRIVAQVIAQLFEEKGERDNIRKFQRPGSRK